METQGGFDLFGLIVAGGITTWPLLLAVVVKVRAMALLDPPAEA